MALPLERREELELEQIEIELLLEGIHRRYGFDFREYAPASLKRRLRRRMDGEKVETVSALQDLILHDPAVMERLLLDLSINVTAMFRDPTFFFAFREKAPGMPYAHPTVEHFAPLFVTLGAAAKPDDKPKTAIEGFFIGLSKRSIEAR